MLGPYPRESGFDPRRRPCPPAAKTGGSFTFQVNARKGFLRSHGPRVGPRSLVDSAPPSRSPSTAPLRLLGPEALTVERPVETRQGEVRALLGPLPSQYEGREPDGEGTALIPRDDVVRLHDALPNDEGRRVGQRQTASFTRRMPGFESLLVDGGRGLKRSRRRVVAPEEAGSSPAGHTLRGIW